MQPASRWRFSSIDDKQKFWFQSLFWLFFYYKMLLNFWYLDVRITYLKSWNSQKSEPGNTFEALNKHEIQTLYQ